MQLTYLRPGERGVVVQITGGRGMQQKLALRGIKEGSWVRMISNSIGPVVVESGETQVALGRGMAGRIMVRQR